jgi:hypothetical protein
MRAEEIRGLMEAYSHVYETPEVLSEEVVEDAEQLDEQGGRAARPSNPSLSQNPIAKFIRGELGQNRNTGSSGPRNRPGSRTSPATRPQIGSLPPSARQVTQYPQGVSTGVGGGNAGASKPTPAAAKPAPKPAAPKPAAPKPAATSAAPKPAAKPSPGTKAAGPESIKPKTPNPLMQRTFGYQKGQAPDQLAKTRETASKNLSGTGALKSSLDIFDLVKGHLLDEGYADSEEGAMIIMVNMSEEWRNSILESYGVEILDEISKELALKAHAERGTREFESDGDNPQDFTKSGKSKADESERRIVKKHGEGARREANRAAEKNIYGHNKYSEAQEREQEKKKTKNEGYQRDPEKGEKEDRKYEKVRGEKTPMPPRGDKRREDFEKWYAKQMGR